MAGFSWKSANNGDFTTSGNWQPNGIPGSGDDAAIALSGIYTVSLAQAEAVRSLTLSGSGATLALDQTLTIGTDLILAAGTLALNYDGTILGGTIVAGGGAAVFTGGTLDGVTYQGTLDLSAASSSVFVRHGITLEGPGGSGTGAIVLTGADSQLNFYDAAILDNAALQIGDSAGPQYSTIQNLDLAHQGATLTLGTHLAVTIGPAAEFVVGNYSNDTLDSKTALAFGASEYASSIDGTGSFLDEGGITVSNGAELNIGDSSNPITFNNIGGISVASGGIVDFGSTTVAKGPGRYEIDAGGTLGLEAGFNQTITFGTDGPGSLLIAKPGGFSGTLADLSAADVIDLNATVSSAVLGATSLSITTTGGSFAYNVSNPGFIGSLKLASDGATGTELIIPCFAGGTRIATPRGDVAVERLAVGDLVLTRNGARQPIVWIGRRRVDCAHSPEPERIRPIRIRAHALGKDGPARDLLLSPDHAVFVDGILIPVRLLVNHDSIAAAADVREVEYFHIELPTHDILFADGLAAESYLDTGHRAHLMEQLGFGAGSAPDGSRGAGSCAPFVTDAASVEPIWRRVAGAAAEWAAGASTTQDPDLRLWHRGKVLFPVLVADGCHVFVVSGAGTARLRSRATRPCDLRPWLDDRRRLGVCVSRIEHDGAETIAVPLDAPELCAGWWDSTEADAGRWTDGDAELPVPPGVNVIEVTIRPLDRYLLDYRRAA